MDGIARTKDIIVVYDSQATIRKDADTLRTRDTDVGKDAGTWIMDTDWA